MKNFLGNLFSNKEKLILLFVFVASLVYFQSFFHELIFLDDDILLYERFESNNVPDKINTAFTTNYLRGHYYRPLTLLSFIVDSEAGGKSPLIYHISNYLIHLLTSLLLFIVLKSIGSSLIISFISSLFFAINPIHINAVGWIAGRGDLLAGFFSIVALFFVVRFIKSNHQVLLFAVSISLFLAILSKEASLLVPLLLTAFIFIEKKEFSLSKTNTFWLLMILFVIGFYYLLRVLLPDVHIDKFSFTTFYNNFFVLLETISKFFIPIGIKALPSINSFTSLSGGIITSILLVLPLIIKRINKLRYYLGLIWFIVLMFPGMVFRTMGQDGFFYWDCRSYLPSIGLILSIVEILKSVELSEHKKWIYYPAVAFLTGITLFSFFMIKLYKDAPSYWGSVKSDYSKSYLPYIGLYNYNNYIGNLYEAENQLLNAINIRPEESSIRQMLIIFYLKNDEEEKAFNTIENAVIKNSFNSDFFLEKFISLSVRTNRLQEIDNLIKKYSSNRERLEQINKLISKEAEDLERKSETTTALRLIEKISN